jgi:2'-5' RNA ligase
MDRFLITIDLTEHLADYAAKLQNEHNRWDRRWLPPHITIIPPTDGEISAEQLQQLREFHFVMDLHSVGWGSFEREDGNVMFLVPQADGLLELWHQVTKILGQSLHTSPKMPKFHITIARQVPKTEWEQVQRSLVKIDPRGHCRVNHLTLYRWDEGAKSWRIEE